MNVLASEPVEEWSVGAMFPVVAAALVACVARKCTRTGLGRRQDEQSPPHGTSQRSH
mgnify:CR=1 FL=1